MGEELSHVAARGAASKGDLALLAARVCIINWPVAHVLVEVYPALIGDRISTAKVPELSLIAPCSVVVEAGFGVQIAAGVENGPGENGEITGDRHDVPIGILQGVEPLVERAAAGRVPVPQRQVVDVPQTGKKGIRPISEATENK